METVNLEKNLAEIFQSDYIVPLYQRNFAWGDIEISQLLEDIYESFEKFPDGNYFIGSLVVLRRHNGKFEVIDGQQRLTTISLIGKVFDLAFADHPRLSYDSRPEVESFFGSFYRTGKTDEVTFDHKVSHLIHAIDIIEETILNPNEKHLITFTDLKPEKQEKFKKYLSEKILLLRVEIPADTDVANYFEIMNNRGEQLQKHEIVKARLLNRVQTNGVHDLHRQSIFAEIWDACSQMDIPIQKLFSKAKREEYFGDNYDQINLNAIDNDGKIGEELPEEIFTINRILKLNKVISLHQNNTADDVEDEGEDRSIIDFPNFLMHVFKLEYDDIYKKEFEDEKENTIPLNEKDLIDVLDKLELKINAFDFVKQLLYYRAIFDKYIIKASADEKAEDNYKWSLERPYKYIYEKRNSSSLKYKNTFEDQERLIKCMSFLQVTFRNRKYKNWLQDVLSWFKEQPEIDAGLFQQKLDQWVLEYYDRTFKDIFNTDNYALGTNTPHFLFNFIDYLYSVKEHERFRFEFKYRNSVEHHLPQSFKNDMNKEWIDNLGNLCLVSKNSNSKMNNEDPLGKASLTGKYHRPNLPPNQKIIYELTNATNAWGVNEITKHYWDLKDLLQNREDLLSLN